MLSIDEQHRQMLYPEVRITCDDGRGSGTIIYSRPDPRKSDHYETYVLTNCHVVSGMIKVEKKWDSFLKRERKMDVLGTPQVELFEYDYQSRVQGGTSYLSDIVAYEKDQDLALLRIRSRRKFAHVAKMYPYGTENNLTCFLPVVNVGCGLGERPVITFGFVSGFGYEIDNYEYMMISAAMIFGNSGGATYLLDTGEFIGVPSRISVVQIGWSVDPITHLGYSIPIWRIYNFLEENIYNFIWDEAYDSAQCEQIRLERRRKSDLELLQDLDDDAASGGIVFKQF